MSFAPVNTPGPNRADKPVCDGAEKYYTTRRAAPRRRVVGRFGGPDRGAATTIFLPVPSIVRHDCVADRFSSPTTNRFVTRLVWYTTPGKYVAIRRAGRRKTISGGTRDVALKGPVKAVSIKRGVPVDSVVAIVDGASVVVRRHLNPCSFGQLNGRKGTGLDRRRHG